MVSERVVVLDDGGDVFWVGEGGYWRGSGGIKQLLELPPEYAYDDCGEVVVGREGDVCGGGGPWAWRALVWCADN